MELPKVDFLYLSEPDMIQAGVKNMAGCIDAMEDVFSLMSKGDYMMGGPNGNEHGIKMMFLIWAASTICAASNAMAPISATAAKVCRAQS